MFKFLIDTADDIYIKNKWKQLKSVVPGNNVVGITTNPNAFFKTNELSLQKWKEKSLILCDLISEIRGDKNGTLHLQFPNSNLTEELFKRWVDFLEKIKNDNAKIAIKIPPFKESLTIAIKHKLHYQLNTTGISDAGTAIFALSHDIKYASIIPGRMEEVGIDAKKNVAYAVNALNNNKKLITGSMRTLEGLKWCVEYGTLPTIGTRVFDLIDEKNCDLFLNWKKQEISCDKYCSNIDEKNLKLSSDFFAQMDEMGKTAYEDLKLLNNNGTKI